MASAPSKPVGKGNFLSIPAELRLNIYELAFTTNIKPGTNIPIAEASKSAPSKALITVNRQVHREAASIYKTAYCQFWGTQHFTLDTLRSCSCARERAKAQIEALSDKQLQNITHLTLRCAHSLMKHPFVAYDNEILEYDGPDSTSWADEKRTLRLTASSPPNERWGRINFTTVPSGFRQANLWEVLTWAVDDAVKTQMMVESRR